MGTRLNRAVEIYEKEGAPELAVRTKDWIAMKSKPWLRRPRMELQKVRLRLEYGPAAPHPLKVITVDPDDVVHMLRPNFYSRTGNKYGTFVIGGEWDRQSYKEGRQEGLMPFEEYCLCKSAIEFFEDGIDWEDTSGYYEEKIAYHGPDWYSSLEDIYESIQNHGYKRQREVESGREETYDTYYMPPEYDEIRVDISRDGEIIFDDGRHRFAAVTVADVDEIPVRVFVRHEQWQALRVEVATADSRAELSARAKQFLDHPDMQDVNGHLET